MMRALVLWCVLSGCFIKPERHPHDSDGGFPDGSPPAPDGNVTPTDAPSRAPNLMFITSGTFALGTARNLAAYQNAEFFCNNAAMHATNPIMAHYLPWMSYDQFNAADALRAKGARAWVRMDGMPIADTVNDLADGTLLNAPSRDENNGDVGAVQAMTGTTGLGINEVGFDLGCSMGVEIGLATATDFHWTENGYNSCGTLTLRIYCFGYDRDGLLP